MPRTPDELPVGEWAVLALLAERPNHGFALARELAPEGGVGGVWSLRRPLVYHAVDSLTERGYARAIGTEASTSGPRRTVLEITPEGAAAVARWLQEPIGHVRDARSQLLLKLLYLNRVGRDPGPLLEAQRAHFSAVADGLAAALDAAEGFDRTVLRWRLESTAAAVRFIEQTAADG